MPALAIIIPCYNEESRLDTEAVAELINGLEGGVLYFVNDGSRDNTLDKLNGLAAKYPGKARVISFSENEGKASAIKKGFQQVLADPSYHYAGYMDADFSTPIDEFINLYAVLTEKKASFIFGSRIKKLNSGINRKVLRHIIGRAISTLIDGRFDLGIYDTQCGAKIFSREIAMTAFDRPFYCKWLFDVEIFIRLKEKNVLSQGIEMPIVGWKDVGGSKLSFKTFPRILKELIVLNFQYK